MFRPSHSRESGVNERTHTLSNAQNRLLPASFQPSSKDVICGRARENYHHDGNRYFRELVQQNLGPYMAAKSKSERGEAIARIVDQVNQTSPFGGFIKKDPRSGRWYQISESEARDKVGHAIRKAVQRLEATKPNLAARMKRDCINTTPQCDNLPSNTAVPRRGKNEATSALTDGTAYAPSTALHRDKMGNGSTMSQNANFNTLAQRPSTGTEIASRLVEQLLQRRELPTESLVGNHLLPPFANASLSSTLSAPVPMAARTSQPQDSLRTIELAKLLATNMLTHNNAQQTPLPFNYWQDIPSLRQLVSPVDSIRLSSAIREQELKWVQELVNARNLTVSGHSSVVQQSSPLLSSGEILQLLQQKAQNENESRKREER